MWKIKPTFISKIYFEISSLQSKVMDKVQKEVERDIFIDNFKHIFKILSITFDWRLKISNGFLKVEVGLIL